MKGQKKLPGVPNWMYEHPNDKKKKIIKNNSYDYLKNLANSGETLSKSTPLVDGFIEYLTTKDADFGKIKPSLRKCTYEFVESIRMELKNKITKINKEQADETANQQQVPDDLEVQSQHENLEAEKSVNEEQDIEDSSAQMSSSSSSDEAANESDIEAPTREIRQKINKKSKRINKHDSDEYWAEHAKRHPDQWREIHYIRESIAGREIELKLMRLKLKQKTGKFFSLPSPVSQNIKEAMNK